MKSLPKVVQGQPKPVSEGRLRKEMMTAKEVARAVMRRRSKALDAFAPGDVTAMLIAERSEKEDELLKGVVRSLETASNLDQRKKRERDMSNKASIKYHRDPKSGGWFHLYRECLDLNNEFVYLELCGVPFEAASSVDLTSETGPGSVAVRIPENWARRLRLVPTPRATKTAQRMPRRNDIGTPAHASKEKRHK